jgi:dihydrodipicolinate synthase/N-acetylneuraminate lyase
MAALVREKRLEDATALQRRLMPLARSVGSTYGVPGLKAALELTGYTGGPPRPPLRPVSSEVVDIIRRQLEALHLIEAAKASAVR